MAAGAREQYSLSTTWRQETIFDLLGKPDAFYVDFLRFMRMERASQRARSYLTQSTGACPPEVKSDVEVQNIIRHVSYFFAYADVLYGGRIGFRAIEALKALEHKSKDNVMATLTAYFVPLATATYIIHSPTRESVLLADAWRAPGTQSSRAAELCRENSKVGTKELLSVLGDEYKEVYKRYAPLTLEQAATMDIFGHPKERSIIDAIINGILPIEQRTEIIPRRGRVSSQECLEDEASGLGRQISAKRFSEDVMELFYMKHRTELPSCSRGIFEALQLIATHKHTAQNLLSSLQGDEHKASAGAHHIPNNVETIQFMAKAWVVVFAPTHGRTCYERQQNRLKMLGAVLLGLVAVGGTAYGTYVYTENADTTAENITSNFPITLASLLTRAIMTEWRLNDPRYLLNLIESRMAARGEKEGICKKAAWYVGFTCSQSVIWTDTFLEWIYHGLGLLTSSDIIRVPITLSANALAQAITGVSVSGCIRARRIHGLVTPVPETSKALLSHADQKHEEEAYETPTACWKKIFCFGTRQRSQRAADSLVFRTVELSERGTSRTDERDNVAV